jgi:hypothetical protein
MDSIDLTREAEGSGVSIDPFGLLFLETLTELILALRVSVTVSPVVSGIARGVCRCLPSCVFRVGS